jgi:uncharacterized membrane protein YgcG
MPHARAWVLCAATVVTGAAAVLSMKAIYTTTVAPTGAKFNKPFFGTIFVSLGMASSLLIWAAAIKCSTAPPRGSGGELASALLLDDVTMDATAGGVSLFRATGQDSEDFNQLEDAAINTTGWSASSSSWRRSAVLVPLACSDLIVSICDNAGIMLAPTSTVSMVNCCILVFCAITTRLVVGTRYSTAQYCGIATAVVGILAVGGAAVWEDMVSADAGGGGNGNGGNSTAPGTGGGSSSGGGGGDYRATLGVGITLGGRVLQSVQFAWEERFMREKRFHPMQQVRLRDA